MDSFDVQLRAEITGNTMTGHAAVFNSPAHLRSHDEVIAPGAFDAVLNDPATDVRALVGHQQHMILGRQSAGTLRLEVDDDGLAFEVDLPDTSYAHDLREMLKRGDITGASFGFIPGKSSWATSSTGRRVRTHTDIKRLIEVSAVALPAYQKASVALRSDGAASEAAIRRTQIIRARARVRGVIA